MKVLVDTNVLIYETFEDSERHAEATDIVYTNEIYIPTIVLHEYIWLLLRHFSISYAQVAAKLEQLLSEKNIHVICENLSDLAAGIRIAAEDGAKPSNINDYIILASALNRGLALATYDRELRRAGARRAVTVLPATL
ncbi:PIN domain-containing protein [Pyrobaculum aerophilum]|uniref:Ribonuclease VapC n=1 Tax=Pyrobaculum aerophilum TaxID=13773 RepID=A0A371QZE3_9CREN|nr:PIN domain-containing protein [Pyrobaculum aerophilum]RFA96139.1 VapC toxin family PIN domain ribonuclease [Pyrobaculum aerophilum]RFA98314.1 VapC toxin family PIN domain ribonuclease [Pyrobaculum aerophilum]